MNGKFFVLKAGIIAEASIFAFAQKFFESLGQRVADGLYKHDNVQVQVISTMPPTIHPNYYIIWQDPNGIWWMQSTYGRWYWSTQGWYPG